MPRSFQKVPGFDPPHGSNVIWRYMGLEKFLDMLENQVLRFTKAGNLSDNRELRLPYERMEALYWETIKENSETERVNASTHQWQVVDSIKGKAEVLRARTYLSCWTITPNESYALWKIYLGGSRAGVAIRTTVAALQKSVSERNQHKISYAKIRYLDNVNPNNMEDSHFIFQKSTHYDYEKELRLAIDYKPDPGNQPLMERFINEGIIVTNSISVAVDINTLIREIYLSPFVIGSFRETFEQIVRKIRPDLEAEVKVSAVRDS
jgi:hypothetical protein